MSRICPLFSGSTGNSTYIATQNGGILVDAGASMRSLFMAVERVGGSFEEIKAIAITHEHIDHIKGLKPFLNKTNAKLIASKQTLEALIKKEIVPSKTEVIEIGEKPLDINGIIINRFATSHDCEGSSGYTFLLADGKKTGVCTDLGIVTDDVRNAITGLDALLIECNHDIEMLLHGPYPKWLKDRVMGEYGHLSNIDSAIYLAKNIGPNTKKILLTHLSHQNNTEEKALETIKEIFAE
jgi:phosphoribosyl 1,2-cyclic phosphodiesterase